MPYWEVQKLNFQVPKKSRNSTVKRLEVVQVSFVLIANLIYAEKHSMLSYLWLLRFCLWNVETMRLNNVLASASGIDESTSLSLFCQLIYYSYTWKYWHCLNVTTTDCMNNYQAELSIAAISSYWITPFDTCYTLLLYSVTAMSGLMQGGAEIIAPSVRLVSVKTSQWYHTHGVTEVCHSVRLSQIAEIARVRLITIYVNLI